MLQRQFRFIFTIMVKILTVNQKSLEQAALVLTSGGLVGMPTETVYGLAADARSDAAVARIFDAKSRPSFNPLIVHVCDVEDVYPLAEIGGDALMLAERLWPGPLTLILKRKPQSGLSSLVTAGLDTVAIRVPAHKTARALMKACGFPIAAPSANISGHLSPTAAAHVAKSLGDRIDLILADGVSAVGLESTVVDCSGEKPVILRPGGVTADALAEILGCDVPYQTGVDKRADVRSPGQLLKHYAPSLPLRLNVVDLEEGEALLAFGSVKFMATKAGVPVKDLPADQVMNLSQGGDLDEAAAHLFSMLYALDDNARFSGIAVMSVPDQGIGVAINDRLRRAAQGRR